MGTHYKVGEMAKLFNISTDTLRYYEEINLLVPKRAENHYRIYEMEDVWKLNVIRDLRDLNFPIEKIEEYLSNRSISSTLQIMEEELEAIALRVKKLQDTKQKLEQRRENLQKAYSTQEGKIIMEYIEKRTYHCIMQQYDKDSEMDVLMKQLINFDKENLYIVGNNQIGSFISKDAISSKKYNSYDSVFVLHPKGEHEMKQGNYLSVWYHGDCQQNNIYIPMMMEYARKNKLEPEGDVIEVVWVDIHSTKYKQENVIQLQMLVRNN